MIIYVDARIFQAMMELPPAAQQAIVPLLPIIMGAQCAEVRRR